MIEDRVTQAIRRCIEVCKELDVILFRLEIGDEEGREVRKRKESWSQYKKRLNNPRPSAKGKK